MNPDLRNKLETKLSSYKDITQKLSTPEIYSDRTQMKCLNHLIYESYTHCCLYNYINSLRLDKTARNK